VTLGQHPGILDKRAGTLVRGLGAVALAAGLAACGPPAPTCSLDAILTSEEQLQTNVVPCGSFTLGDPVYTDDAMRAAQLCVLGAIQRKQAFTLRYDAKAADGDVRAAFAGTLRTAGDGTAVLRVRAFAASGQSPNSSSSPQVSVRTCDSLTATNGCRASVGAPCLICNMPVGAQNLCVN
jgi:hypothetical protein